MRLAAIIEEAVGAGSGVAPAAPAGPELLPLDAGEQYRFGFAMDACIGCHSCEVACAEQNDTPIDVAWRRVGELEGGTYPQTRRFNLSMACNHCLEPTCLSGCPTNAYVKLGNGVVRHDAEECIGCQYCIWNCPYEVPVFDQRRKIVSKCDMCLPRLEAGQAPACVGACPTHAITVEKVDVAAWRADHAAADAPGLPPADITLSTTRVALPEGMPADTAAASDHRVDPEDPHWPLIGLTLLTQLSLGIVAATVATQLAGSAGRGTLAGGAVGGAVAGATALAASLLHLGRPTHAFKALRNLRTSWLSREVALFSAFAAVSFLYAGVWRAAVREGVPAVGAALGVAAVLLGAAGVYASGRLYLVPARPVWNSRRTLVSFFATGLSVGPLVTLFCLDRAQVDPPWIALLLGAAGTGTLLQLAVHAHLVRTVRGREDRQHRGTATLLGGRFRDLVAARLVLAGTGLTLLVSAFGVPLAGSAAAGRFGAGLLVLGIGEVIGRYLFYVTVVPFGTAGNFFARN
ncbi:MAG TPA: DmsC/YnfH family molybdoenzyme membrane anchor subunit [Acidimicrobiales bacterium]|nr:DmsC/YnfH family molybdoenzyme membrane anchor subunit [Acidimicrobiales bacterium]